MGWGRVPVVLDEKVLEMWVQWCEHSVIELYTLRWVRW